MKLEIIPDRRNQVSARILGEVVNGFNLAEFPDNAKFMGNEETSEARIYGVERIDGELFVTVGQCGLAYECQPTNGSHDWRGTGEWIDAKDYNPDSCYIVATSAPNDAEYVKRDNGWTVVVPVAEEGPAE